MLLSKGYLQGLIVLGICQQTCADGHGSRVGVHVYTIATATKACAYRRFQAFAMNAQVNFSLLSFDETTKAAGGQNLSNYQNGAKITLIAAAASQLPPEELVVYTDAYDSIIVIPKGVTSEQRVHPIEAAFIRALNTAGLDGRADAVLFGAETNLHVHYGSSRRQVAMTARVRAAWAAALKGGRMRQSRSLRYRYLNAGGFAGRAGSIVRLMQAVSESSLVEPSSWNGQSDQSLFSAAYILGLKSRLHAGAANPPTMVLDTGRHLIASSAHVTESTRDVFVERGGGLLFNQSSTPVIYHMPGCKDCSFDCDLSRMAALGLVLPGELRESSGSPTASSINPLTCHTTAECNRALEVGAQVLKACDTGSKLDRDDGSCYRYHRWKNWRDVKQRERIASKKSLHHGLKARGVLRQGLGTQSGTDSDKGADGGTNTRHMAVRRAARMMESNTLGKNMSRKLRRAARLIDARTIGKNASRKSHRLALPFNSSLIDPPTGPPPPPCPSSTKVSTKMRYKLSSRQFKCSQPGVLPPSPNDAVPLIWSRELVERQRVFRNENPFMTSKFRPFLAQLPPTSNMTRILRDGLCPNPSGGLMACDTCAVVGASGSLLNWRHGQLIDAHQVVVRPNWLLTKGYEQLVGTRTDLNLFFGVEGMIDQFDTAQRKLPHAQRAIGLVTSASDRSIASFFRHMARVLKRPTGFGTSSSIYLLSDSLFHRALGALCAATNGGCDWQRPTSRMRPSTGFFSVMLALHLCRKVSLFGLTTDTCKPFHYYGPPKNECTIVIPPKNDESVHWFEKEHEIYGELQKRGRIMVYS